LFDPRDRTTQRTSIPIRTAIYEKSAGDSSTTAIPASLDDRQRAERAAQAWTAMTE
jgi:hypothetical protein